LSLIFDFELAAKVACFREGSFQLKKMLSKRMAHLKWLDLPDLRKECIDRNLPTSGMSALICTVITHMQSGSRETLQVRIEASIEREHRNLLDSSSACLCLPVRPLVIALPVCESPPPAQHLSTPLQTTLQTTGPLKANQTALLMNQHPQLAHDTDAA
jgi:hypothetical protein